MRVGENLSLRQHARMQCKGCGSEDRPNCKIYGCCREDQQLNYCTECEDFPGSTLKKSVGVHPDWLEDLAQLPLKKA
jgi:hypothetical protein